MRPLSPYCLTLCAMLAPSVHAQGYPAKPVRVVLGFPAGTNVDVLVRPVAQKMGEMLGQPVIVDKGEVRHSAWIPASRTRRPYFS